MANDDEAWLAALRGKDSPGATSAAQAEAERIRNAMAAARAAIPQIPDLDVDAAWSRFEQAARREGLMADASDRTDVDVSPIGTTARGGSGEPRRRTGLWAGVSALLVAFGTMLYIGSGPALLGTRGSETLPPMYRADPRDAATAMQNDLTAAGARVTAEIIDPASGATRLMVDLGSGSKPGDTLDAALEKHRVPRASGARFTVEIIPLKAP